LIFGDGAQSWTIHLSDAYNSVLPEILPLGAFICLSLLIALKNLVDAKVKKPGLMDIPVEVRTIRYSTHLLLQITIEYSNTPLNLD